MFKYLFRNGGITYCINKLAKAKLTGVLDRVKVTLWIKGRTRISITQGELKKKTI